MNTEQLKKYLSGDASQSEKEEVQLWLEADENNKKEFMSLRTLYDITLAHLDEPSAQSLVNRRRKSKTIWLEIAKIAAVILITIGTTFYFMQTGERSVADEVAMQSLFIPAGQRAELVLADGTKVWLNSLTTFTFPNRFTELSREVFLDGEGYFEVTHDTEKKFTVHTGNYAVNVLGTEFNISSYNKVNQFETSLLTGSVEIVSKQTNESVLLTPGNRVYLEDGRLVVDEIRHSDHFLWKKGIISFDNERIEDILKKIQLYFDVEIQNENKSIRNIRYTGKFRTKDGVETVLNVLKIPTGMTYTKDSDNNIILIR